MTKVLERYLKNLVAFVTICICVPYLSTILIPWVNTGKYWYLSILGLGFPILFVLLVCVLVFWIIWRNKKWIIICLVVLLAGFQQISVAFGFHFFSDFQLQKAPEHLRVMQWNVHNWNQIIFENESGFDTAAHPHMMDLIDFYNADVICIQEFFESENRTEYRSSTALLDSLGYKHNFFWNPGMVDGHYYAGIAIFSKYPILKANSVTIDPVSNTDPLIYADVDVNGRTIRVMSIHLQSVEFGEDQYENLSKIKKVRRPESGESRTIVSKLKRGFQRRYGQALEVNRQVAGSPYPVVLCADLNDVPNSGAYFALRRNMQDAFLKKGHFIGRTFRLISPTLRIDYIMADQHFKVEQFERIRAPYSDHFPLVADLSFNRPE